MIENGKKKTSLCAHRSIVETETDCAVDFCHGCILQMNVSQTQATGSKFSF